MLRNFLEAHLIHTKFEANPCSSLREVEKLKKVNDDDGHSLIARVTLTH